MRKIYYTPTHNIFFQLKDLFSIVVRRVMTVLLPRVPHIEVAVLLWHRSRTCLASCRYEDLAYKLSETAAKISIITVAIQANHNNNVNNNPHNKNDHFMVAITMCWTLF